MNGQHSLSRYVWILAVLLPLAACDRGPSPEVQARLDSLQATRDSLTRELAEQNEYVHNLSRRIEDAVGDVNETGVTLPEAMEDRIETMRSELESARARLAETRQRAANLSNRASVLRDSLNTVVRERDEALAMQRDSIDTLLHSLHTMTQSMDELSRERTSLETALGELESKHYTVYYVVGTRDELVERGIIEEEGGARILFLLWKAGETLVPARDLDPEQFQAIDFRQTGSIELPEPGSYVLVSRHDTSYVEPLAAEDGRITGESLQITEPEEFWRSSRYLILVREG